MGTGKTEVFLALCEKLNVSRVLVVCPKTLVLEWKARIKQRLNEDAAVPSGIEDGKHLRFSLDTEHFTHRFLIINYEMLRMQRYTSTLQLIPWDIIGFDEGHRLKSYKAKQTKGSRLVAWSSKRVYFITATPFTNYPDELWPSLNTMFPVQYPSRTRFVQEFCFTQPTKWGPKIIAARNTETLKEILSKIMIRRMKKDVLQDLPEKLSVREIPLQMDPVQENAYRSMEKEFVVALKNGEDLFAATSLARLMRLRQLALDPDLIEVLSPSAKTNALLDILGDITDTKVVVFSFFSSYLKHIHQLLADRPHEVLTGETPTEDRVIVRQRFQEDPDTKIMLASLGVGGMGIDLHAASVCIFTDVFWTPAVNHQAEDRLHRIGQKNPVTVIRLVLPNTIDDDMQEILRRKEKVFTETMAIQTAVKRMMERYP